MTIDAIRGASDADLEQQVTILMAGKHIPVVDRHCSSESLAVFLEDQCLIPEERTEYFKLMGRKLVSYDWRAAPRRRIETWVFIKTKGQSK